MSRQSWVETIAVATAAGTAVANTTTETILFPNITIPANYLADGRTMSLRASGMWSTTTGSPTMTFNLRAGVAVTGVQLCTTAAIITPATAISLAAWDLDIIITVRTNGATAALMAFGRAIMFAGVAPTISSSATGSSFTGTGVAATTPMTNNGVLFSGAGTATVDATGDQPLALCAKWSANSASNTITGTNYALRSEN